MKSVMSKGCWPNRTQCGGLRSGRRNSKRLKPQWRRMRRRIQKNMLR